MLKAKGGSRGVVSDVYAVACMRPKLGGLACRIRDEGMKG
jgi:hypothetical protein